MAKIPEGILGNFIGKAGPVSGHMWNGQNIIRTSSRRKDNRVTPKRIAQQQKIKVCNDFTKVFTGTGFFSKSFPSYGDTGTGYNRATSALMNLAIVDVYPNTTIAYSKVLISQGPLPAAENAIAIKNADGNIFFSWTDNSDTGTAKASDKVIVVAFFPVLKKVTLSLHAAVRADCQAVLTIDPDLQDYIVETWIGFLNNDGKDAANSCYTGSINL